MHLTPFLRLLFFQQFCTFCCFAINQYPSYDDMPTTTDRNFYTNSLICMDIKPQHSVDIEQITGLWYGNEIIVHTQDIPGVYEYQSCVIIHLNDITEQMRNHYSSSQYAQQYNQRRSQDQQQQQQQQQHQIQLHNTYNERSAPRYLRLIWSESDNNLEYMFNYTERSPGLWKNIAEQRGSLVALNPYKQFTGTVQVVKAVNDHLVLTFCGNDMASSIYTLVLSRTQKGLSLEELRSIRGLLSRRGLYTETIRKVCSSAATTTTIINSVLLPLIACFAMFKSYF
ncbi:probable transcription-associated protein 1 [Ceratitis capitata]|uniref:probable transcription-associated protein 1 n=1 Tax=Ceratitis capitata TaxID=7213 RepID=UPI0003299144|nr:probable transcription-associated protein 1 [Ceratitis capitata]